MEIDWGRYCITRKKDILTFYHIIHLGMPKSVLDAGCFLKRAGVVSRYETESYIDDSIRLDTLDNSGFHLPIYERIYNNIYDPMDISIVEDVELVMMFGMPEIYDELTLEIITSWAVKHSDMIAADEMSLDVIKGFIPSGLIKDVCQLTMNDSACYLIYFKI